MSRFRYLSIEALIDLIDEPNRTFCHKMLQDNWNRFNETPGSSKNHQAWRGGYLDHVVETMNIFRVDYISKNSQRPLPFSLSDGLLVMFLHDLEKAWLYRFDRNGHIRKKQNLHKAARKKFRADKIAEYGIELTPDQENALLFVEGIPDEPYTPGERLMQPLAALCHNADNWSARGWYDYPKDDDPWISYGKPRNSNQRLGQVRGH